MRLYSSLGIGLVGLALIGCPQASPVAGPSTNTGSSPSVPKADGDGGPECTTKQAGPVRIEGVAWSGSASISLTFLEAGTDVTVRLSGTDGLKVQGNAVPLLEGRVLANQRVEHLVTHEPGPGDSSLVVSVTGTFAKGRRRSVVQAFGVKPRPDPTRKVGAPAQRPAPGRVEVDEGGQRIIIMGEESK